MNRKKKFFAIAIVLLITCVVTILIYMLNGQNKEFSGSPVWIKSHFSSTKDMAVMGKVWAIACTRHLPQGEQKTIFQGSAWLFEKNSAGVAFVTADHVLHEKGGLFDNSQGDILSSSFSLQHISGTILPIEIKNIVEFKDKDIAFIIIILPKECLQELSKYLSKLSTITGNYYVDDLIGKDVYNLGFPLRAQKYASQKSLPFFSDFIRIQSGKILNGTIESHIFKSPTKCFVLNYVSEPGFSGGPLFLKESGQVIGLMHSCIIPEKNGELATKCIAICIEEIYDAYKTMIKR